MSSYIRLTHSLHSIVAIIGLHWIFVDVEELGEKCSDSFL